MIKRLIFGFLLAVLAIAFVGPCASAQTVIPPCLIATSWGFEYPPPPPGWFIVFDYIYPFTYLIGSYSSGCVPAAAKDETCPFCPRGGKPISLATGDTFITDSDVSLPGLGGGLNLTRTWNSLWPATQAASSIGMFGPNWKSTYEERVFMGGDNWLKYSRSDGSYWSLGTSSFGVSVVAAPANASATLTTTATYMLLTFQNGEQRRFSLTTGQMIAIVDRNGNTTQLTYDASSRLTTVTDPASRHLYFNYPSPSSFLVSSVTSDFGVTISYAYDGQGRLIQVTKPDSSTINYTYNAQSKITQVTDSAGKVLESHTYDSSGRGLTSAQANGVNSLSITY